ncbi:phage antirepressor KilAC domain-containing protein [Chitinimonas lacunae]|uniref:Phage antirepressor KilAC domain-containing protein n=1 Tax=Chitinimonas lacunae TaxID=1963018 RepID=A0ABV8MM09_9NEIS
MTDAAKQLQMRPKDLIAWLSQHHWIYRRSGSDAWTAYQERIERGLLEHKVTTVEREDGTEKVVTQARVTAKGLARLAEEVSRRAAA